MVMLLASAAGSSTSYLTALQWLPGTVELLRSRGRERNGTGPVSGKGAFRGVGHLGCSWCVCEVLTGCVRAWVRQGTGEDGRWESGMPCDADRAGPRTWQLYEGCYAGTRDETERRRDAS